MRLLITALILLVCRAGLAQLPATVVVGSSGGQSTSSICCSGGGGLPNIWVGRQIQAGAGYFKNDGSTGNNIWGTSAQAYQAASPSAVCTPEAAAFCSGGSLSVPGFISSGPTGTPPNQTAVCSWTCNGFGSTSDMEQHAQPWP